MNTSRDKFAVSMTKSQWADVMGWLRNGNPTAVALADEIKLQLDPLRHERMKHQRALRRNNG